MKIVKENKIKEDLAHVTDIDWETDGEDIDLPVSVDVPLGDRGFFDDEELEEYISDYLSDRYGFLHNGFYYELKHGVDESLKKKRIKEDIENLETTETTTVVDQPMGAAKEESKNLWQRFLDATKEPEDAPLFGAKEQPKPEEPELPKITLDESLFEESSDRKSIKEAKSGEKASLRELQKKLREILKSLREAHDAINVYVKGNENYTPLVDNLFEARNGLLGAIDDIDKLASKDVDESLKEDANTVKVEVEVEQPEAKEEKEVEFSDVCDDCTDDNVDDLFIADETSDEPLTEESTLPKGGKDKDFDTDVWSLVYWELSGEGEDSTSNKRMGRKAKVNLPLKDRYNVVDPVNDFDLRVYAADESGFENAKKIADAYGLEYKIENTNKTHSQKHPEASMQMTIFIPEEMVG